MGCGVSKSVVITAESNETYNVKKEPNASRPIIVPLTASSTKSTFSKNVTSELKKCRQERTVRVFVSSTFRDMGLERDVLNRVTFPRLLELCEKRDLFFASVDLRWGVTSEDSGSGRVLNLCLEEIDRSRPFFICLIGERYGWHQPPQGPEDALLAETFSQGAAMHPWIDRYRDRSVTECEILYGALLRPVEDTKQSFFYFRDPTFVNTVPVDDRQVYFSESEHAAVTLRRLKDEVRQKPGLAVRENYLDLSRLAQDVYDDLAAAIELAFPDDDVTTPDQQEELAHERRADGLKWIYVPLKPDLDRLDEYLAADQSQRHYALCISGQSGSGKSALVAHWAADHSERFPTHVIHTHFVGASSESTSQARLLRRILLFLSAAFPEQTKIKVPEDPYEALKSFHEFAAQYASVPSKVVLVVDGLESLDVDTDQWSAGLGWLPKTLPPPFYLVLTTTSKDICQEIERRGGQVCEMSAMDEGVQEELTTRFLLEYSKKLAPEQLKTLVEAPQTANPRFLCAVLEELRIFGRFERLNDKLAACLSAPTTPDLYRLVIERWKGDFGDIAVRVLGMIRLSRLGLSEDELRSLVSTDPQTWSALFINMREVLLVRSGVYVLEHQDIVTALDDYLPETIQTDFRHQLIEMWKKRPLLGGKGGPVSRKAQELPWLYKKLQDWTGLAHCLSDPDLILELSLDKNLYEMRQLWREILSKSDISMAKTYDDMMQREETMVPRLERGKLVELLLRLGQHFGLFYMPDDSVKYIERAYRLDSTSGSETLRTAEILEGLGAAYKNYMATFQPEVMAFVRLGAPEDSGQAYRDSLTSMAEPIRTDAGKAFRAFSLVRSAIRIRELQDSDRKRIAEAKFLLATLYLLIQDFETAKSIANEVIEMYRQVDDTPSWKLSKFVLFLGQLYLYTNDLPRALELSQQALDITVQCSGPDSLDAADALANLGAMYSQTNRHEEAIAAYERCLKNRAEMAGAEHPNLGSTMGNLASALYRAGQYERAEETILRGIELFSRNPEVAKEIADHELRRLYLTLAYILTARGDSQRAMRIMFALQSGQDISALASAANIAGIKPDKNNNPAAPSLTTEGASIDRSASYISTPVLPSVIINNDDVTTDDSANVQMGINNVLPPPKSLSAKVTNGGENGQVPALSETDGTHQGIASENPSPNLNPSPNPNSSPNLNPNPNPNPNPSETTSRVADYVMSMMPQLLGALGVNSSNNGSPSSSISTSEAPLKETSQQPVQTGASPVLKIDNSAAADYAATGQSPLMSIFRTGQTSSMMIMVGGQVLMVNGSLAMIGGELQMAVQDPQSHAVQRVPVTLDRTGAAGGSEVMMLGGQLVMLDEEGGKPAMIGGQLMSMQGMVPGVGGGLSGQ